MGLKLSWRLRMLQQQFLIALMCFDSKESKKLQGCLSIIQYFYNGGKIIDMFLFGNKTPNEPDILTERHLAKINVTTTLH